LRIHATTQPSHKDEKIVTVIRKLVSKEKPEELSDEECNRASDLVQQLVVILVGARTTGSIFLFTHVRTMEVLQSVREMYDSGPLTDIVRDLFRCLAKDETLTVELDISAITFKQCESGFANDGKLYCYFV